jgi:hypothetical protein
MDRKLHAGVAGSEAGAPVQLHDPLQQVDSDSGDRSGIGDIALNYRYQLAGSGDTKFACTPRLSLLLPTGDEERGLLGGAGVQPNVAASTVLSKGLVAHTNLGATYTRTARNELGDEASVTGLNAGQSFIWNVIPTFNVMLETVWLRTETVVGPNRTERTNSFFVSPGIRWAHNLPTGLQIVPGVAFPLGCGIEPPRALALALPLFRAPDVESEVISIRRAEGPSSADLAGCYRLGG